MFSVLSLKLSILWKVRAMLLNHIHPQFLPDPPPPLYTSLCVFLKNKLFCSRCPNPLAVTIPPSQTSPLAPHPVHTHAFGNVPWALGIEVLVNVLVRSRHPHGQLIYIFEHLWLSVVISLCCQKKLFRWGWGSTLTCEY